MIDILAGLNLAQKEAVEVISGPLLILAGPGSGKTRVIIQRIGYLIKVCGVSPYRIMAVTFTNKAAREMKERLLGLVSGSMVDLTMGTFHAICARIMRRDGKAISVDSNFVIYDDNDQIGLIKNAIKQIGLDPKQYAPRAIASAISAAKNAMLTPQEYSQHSGSYFEEVVGRVYERYQQLLKGNNALDFDDLLMKTVQLFKTNPEMLSRYQSRYQHILVDEFQDTNLVQYELVKLLAGKFRNICVVGDPDQSIYSWRSADLRNILNFEKDYPDAKVVVLEQNYRSTKMILDTASSLISANQQRKHRELWTDNEAGELTTVVETYNEQEEAQFVLNEIERLVEQDHLSLADCAVMYRTNVQSRVLEEAFLRYGVPYKLVASMRFYERREVKDIIAYLRLIQNPYDNVSLLRVINVPGRGIGQRSLIQLNDWAKLMGVSQYESLRLLYEDKVDNKPPFAPRIIKVLTSFLQMFNGFVTRSRELDVVSLLDLLIEDTGYHDYVLKQDNGEERWENILELRTVAQQFQDLVPPDGLAAFLEEIALVSNIDGLDENGGGVTLITLHQAKGLEFPVVFIVGVEEGILPHYRSLDDQSQMEEERRLCYVGITRAKQRVYLIHAFRRNRMGSSVLNKPSRFLGDIPRHLVTGNGLWRGEDNQITSNLRRWDEPQMSKTMLLELTAGDHVHHTQFGDGTIVSCQSAGDDEEVVVAFKGTGIKKLLLSFAKLEKVEPVVNND
ncbi:MAG: UvrD-helicase domain-containing protein [Dehalococcoidales bacterium]|nr:UvrD-helicase domain-containing protein [Dehalococcoidales bacterium]